MPTNFRRFTRSFSDRPHSSYVCPACKSQLLKPDLTTFLVVEPLYSKAEHGIDEWDPDWMTYRFSVKYLCDSISCGEIAFVAGSGSVDQRYDQEGCTEYYDSFRIRSFFPAPYLINLPKDLPIEILTSIERSFALYWLDTSAASNALRTSLEALLDELKVPRQQLNSNGGNDRLSLHRRLDIWKMQRPEFAEMCFALKEVGNLGSHGETVSNDHYFGALEIYSHVLAQLFDNSAEKFKELARKIASEIKKKTTK